MNVITRSELWPARRAGRDSERAERERWHYDLFLMQCEIEGRVIVARGEDPDGKAWFRAGAADEAPRRHPPAARLGHVVRAAVENELPLPPGLLLYLAGRLHGSITPRPGRPNKGSTADVIKHLWPLWRISETRGRYDRQRVRGALRRACADVHVEMPLLGIAPDRVQALYKKAQRHAYTRVVLALARLPAAPSRYSGATVSGVTLEHVLADWLPLAPALGFESADVRAILAAVIAADRGRKTR